MRAAGRTSPDTGFVEVSRQGAQAGPPPGLIALGGQPTKREYLRQVLSRRQFIYHLAAGDLRKQHLNSVLGNVWHVLNPLLLVGVYYLIFGVLFARTRTDLVSQDDSYIAFLAVGVFIFGFLQRCVTNGANAIISHIGLIRSLQFPRAVLPTATVTKETLSFGPSLVVLVVVLLLAGERPGWAWLGFPLVFAAMVLFGLGGALAAARVAEQVQDIKNVLPFAFRLTFYLSGVLFNVDHVVRGRESLEPFANLLLINPFYVFVSLARLYLLQPSVAPPAGLLWLSAGIWTVGLLVLGFLYFLRLEKSYGRG
jgi:teichoic acid transport system permease protein